MPKFLNSIQWYDIVNNTETGGLDAELLSSYPIIPTTISKANSLPIYKNAIYYNSSGFNLFGDKQYPFTLLSNPNYIEVNFGGGSGTTQKTVVGIGGWNNQVFQKFVTLKRTTDKVGGFTDNTIWQIELPENKLLLWSGTAQYINAYSLTPSVPTEKGTFRIEIQHNGYCTSPIYANAGIVRRYFDFSFNKFYPETNIQAPSYKFDVQSLSSTGALTVTEKWNLNITCVNYGTGSFLFKLNKESGNGTSTVNLTKIWFIVENT